MRISDSVANYILQMLNDENGIAEIQRNELANTLGCVPSQINYVITSRFTPEQGYIVESRLHSHHSPEHDKIRFNHAHCQFHRA